MERRGCQPLCQAFLFNKQILMKTITKDGISEIGIGPNNMTINLIITKTLHMEF
jgi:hypothetical protein